MAGAPAFSRCLCFFCDGPAHAGGVGGRLAQRPHFRCRPLLGSALKADPEKKGAQNIRYGANLCPRTHKSKAGEWFCRLVKARPWGTKKHIQAAHASRHAHTSACSMLHAARGGGGGGACSAQHHQRYWPASSHRPVSIGKAQSMHDPQSTLTVRSCCLNRLLVFWCS